MTGQSPVGRVWPVMAVATAAIKLPEVECEKCGYRWNLRAPKIPAICANKKCKARGKIRLVSKRS